MKHVQRPFDVDRVDLARFGLQPVARRQRGQVKDVLHASEGFPQKLAITNVSDDHFETPAARHTAVPLVTFRRRLQVGERPGRKIVEDPYGDPSVQELVDQM